METERNNPNALPEPKVIRGWLWLVRVAAMASLAECVGYLYSQAPSPSESGVAWPYYGHTTALIPFLAVLILSCGRRPSKGALALAVGTGSIPLVGIGLFLVLICYSIAFGSGEGPTMIHALRPGLFALLILALLIGAPSAAALPQALMVATAVKIYCATTRERHPLLGLAWRALLAAAFAIGCFLPVYLFSPRLPFPFSHLVDG